MEEGSGGGEGSSRVSDSTELRIEDFMIDMDLNKVKKLVVRNPGKCMTKVTLIPTMQVRLSKIREKIYLMQDHVLNGKVFGLQPS